MPKKLSCRVSTKSLNWPKRSVPADASKLGLMMVIVHARGEQGGSMCSSCICALAKFVAASGLDPAMLQVKFPTRLSRRLNEQRWVSPFTAFRDVVLHKLQALGEIEFKDCAMNDHGARIDMNTKQVGQTVSTIVKEILENQADHWSIVATRAPTTLKQTDKSH